MNKNVRNGIIQSVFIVLFLVVTFAASRYLNKKSNTLGQIDSAERILPVRVFDASPVSDYRLAFTTTGVVEAGNEIGIVPQVSGRVIYVSKNFLPGGSFDKDELLFRVDPADLELSVDQLEADVASAKTNLSLAQAEANVAVSEWYSGNGSGIPVPDLVARKPQLKEASTKLQSAQARLLDAKLKLSRTYFRFPFSGRVTSSNIAVGQYVVAGQNSGKVFNNDDLEVEVSLNAYNLESLLRADEPEITIWLDHFGDDKAFKGFLKAPPSSLNSETRFATLRFGFSESEDTSDLLPGFFATVDIVGEKLQRDVMLLPVSAVQYQDEVWVVEDEVLVKWKPEIISFTENEQVVVSSYGRPVQVVSDRIQGGIEGVKVEVVSVVPPSDNDGGY